MWEGEEYGTLEMGFLSLQDLSTVHLKLVNQLQG